MSYSNDFAPTRGPIVFDLETAPLLNAADYLDPVEAAKNLKDPEKIAKDIAERTAERDDKCGLDYNTARIVALGTWAWSGNSQVEVHVCQCEADEREAIRLFWAMQQGRTLIGFRCREFDLPMLIQRSRYLGLMPPEIDLGKYARTHRVIDLYDLLTFQDSQRTFAMRRTLHNFCRRFGIPVTDTTAGADIAALVKAEDWTAIVSHCDSDVRLTRELAERVGVLTARVMVPEGVRTATVVETLRQRPQRPKETAF